jgi:Prenyltransferase and squalene oxidase repeat
MRYCKAITIALALSAAAGWSIAAPIPGNVTAATSPNVDKSVVRGLDYLATHQKKDGSFTDQGPRIAVTSLGLLSFLSAGETPGLGKYGSMVRSAIDFLIQQAPADGYVGKLDGSRMYGQAITTLALAEAWGVEQSDSRRARIRTVVTNCARVIIEAQKVNKPPQFAGGWRYEPQSADSDVSLSGWNILALEACLGDGLEIPRDSAVRAVAFVLKCHRSEGGFSYQPGGGDISTSSTGAAVLCLYLLNGGAGPERADGLKYLRDHPVDDQARFPYYAMYYLAHAAVQSQDVGAIASSNQALERLMKMQQPDGSWPQSKSGEEPGVQYATAMAILTLEAPYKLLPVYQQ